MYSDIFVCNIFYYLGTLVEQRHLAVGGSNTLLCLHCWNYAA